MRRALVEKYEPTSKASVVGTLAEVLRTLVDGDLFDAFTNFEREIMIYEARSRETISDSREHWLRHCRCAPEQHLLVERNEMLQQDNICSRD